MKRPTLLLASLFLFACPVFLGACASSEPTEDDPMMCGGGCAAPPTCNPDGTAPSPYPECSCGCFEGQRLFGGRCNENGCVVLDADGGNVGSDAGADAGADAGVDAGE